MGTRFVSMLLGVALLAGCATERREPPSDAPQERQAMAPLGLVAIDDRTDARIEGARLDVQFTEMTDDGRSDADGYISLNAPTHIAFVVQLHAAGYEPWESVVSLTGGLHLEARMARKESGPGGHPAPLVGRLRVAGSCFRDDAGCVNPLYAHAGDLFSLYTRDPDRARQELDAIARAGYHGLRTWSTLGGEGWRGREVGDSVTPGYLDQVRRFFGDVRTRSLRLVWSQGDIGHMRDRRGTMAAFANLDNEVGGVIDFIDCGNEAYQTGEPDPRRLAECVGHYRAAGGRALLSLTDAPLGGNPYPKIVDDYSIPPADVFDIHSHRDGHSWDKRRHIWSYTYCGDGCPRLKFGIGSEPPGNGALVSVTSNKHELDDEAVALLGLASILSRQAFVWFSGEGVILDRGLSVEAGFAATPRAVALLPRDVMTYDTIHHSGGSWRGTRVVAAPDDEVRIDGRIAGDGRFAYTIDGPGGTWRLPVERSFAGQLCHPGTGACEDVSRRAGEVLEVSFTRGRLLVGRVAPPASEPPADGWKGGRNRPFSRSA